MPHNSSSQPPSGGMRDVEGLASLALFELVATFLVEAPKKVRSLAFATSLQFPIVEGPMRGGELGVEIAAVLDLDSVMDVRAHPSAASRGVYEAMGSVLPTK